MSATRESAPTLAHACGALGRYDRGRIEAIAAALDLDRPVAVVHEDRQSILALDREPLRWGRRPMPRGLGWSELPPGAASGRHRRWEDFAAGGAGCGLVIAAGERLVHSSVSGVAPIYYVADRDAVYFATRIDPLARTSPTRLEVDWDAWAAILTLDHPIGDRTPFAEIRRLPPFSVLCFRAGRAEVSERRWPWAEIEPDRKVGAGAGELLERLRESIAGLPAGPIACQLSGGLDSRLCLGLLAEARSGDVRTLTVDHDGGTDRELRVAARLARAYGVPHEEVTGAAADYWAEVETRTGRVDHQFVRPPWRMPLLGPLRRSPSLAVDGFGFDVLAGPGNRYFTAEAIDPRGRVDAVRALWDRMQARQRHRTSGLRNALSRALWDSARRQLIADSRRYRGHPSRSVLTFYRSRQVRGICMTPYAILGAEVPVAMPLVDDAVARSALSISFPDKAGARLYIELFRALDPRLAELASTSHGRLPAGSALPTRARSPLVADPLLAAVEAGPLAPFVRGSALRRMSRHRRGRPAAPPFSLLGAATFHLWHRRHRDVLGDVDPGAAFGVAPREPRRTLGVGVGAA